MYCGDMLLIVRECHRDWIHGRHTINVSFTSSHHDVQAAQVSFIDMPTYSGRACASRRVHLQHFSFLTSSEAKSDVPESDNSMVNLVIVNMN